MFKENFFKNIYLIQSCILYLKEGYICRINKYLKGRKKQTKTPIAMLGR